MAVMKLHSVRRPPVAISVRGKCLQLFAGIVLVDSGVVAVLPAVDATDQILPLDVAVRQQDATLLAAT